MHKKDILFVTIFFIALSSILYFTGTAITGYVVQSISCQEGVCQELCSYHTDCIDEDMVCCEEGDISVCRAIQECVKHYANYSSNLENPDDFTKQKIGGGLLMALFVTMFAFAHIAHHKLTVDRKNHSKKGDKNNLEKLKIPRPRVGSGKFLNKGKLIK